MRKAFPAILSVSLILVFVAAVAYNVSNYTEQGGERTVIGGSLDIVSGGELDVESGAAFKVAGTAVTATAAELNTLDGITATVSELNILDGVTSDASELNILDGVTSTTTQLNEIVYHEGAPPVAVVDHTGECADAETVTVSGRVYEYDTDSSITGDVDVDISGGSTATDCATALIAAINGDGSATVEAADFSNGTVALVALSAASSITLAETLTNGIISTTSGFGGAAAGRKRAYGCTHTVSANEVTTTTDQNGAIAVCGLTLTSSPTVYVVDIRDSNGVESACATCQFSWSQINSDQYVLKLVETQNGATALTAGDVVNVIVLE